MTGVKVAVVSAEVSRPVRKGAVESEVGESQVLEVPSKEPVVFRGGQEAGKYALWPPLE